MDVWTLVAATVAIGLTLAALYWWGPSIWNLWLWDRDRDLDHYFSTNVVLAKGGANTWFLITTFVGVIIPIAWILVKGFHWNTVVAFVWPYIIGYVWARVIARRALKQRNVLTVLFALIVTLFALGALFAVIDIAQPLLALFSVSFITFSIRNDPRVDQWIHSFGWKRPRSSDNTTINSSYRNKT